MPEPSDAAAPSQTTGRSERRLDRRAVLPDSELFRRHRSRSGGLVAGLAVEAATQSPPEPRLESPRDEDRASRSVRAKSAQDLKLLVLIVAYNAEETIEWVLDRIAPATWRRIAEVVIFDDCSRDHTSDRAVDWRSRPFGDKVRIFRNQTNLGYGGNQKRGYRYAIEHGFDAVVLLHGDGQYAPEDLDRLIDPIADGEADVVFGSRMMEKGAALRGGMPLYKFVGNKVLTAYQNLMLGQSLTEYHSGYRAYRVAALKELQFLRNTNGFHFDTEIILQLLNAGKRIIEAPIPTYYGDEICYVNGVPYAARVALATLRYRLHRAGLGYCPQYELPPCQRYAFKTGRWSSHQQLVRRIQRFAAGRSLRILDVGCGSGSLAAVLRRAGHYVVGVDAAPGPNRNEAFDEFLARDLNGGLGDVGDAPFDAVLLSDVLEHLSAPEKLLLDARERLADGGRVFASSGNVANWYIRFQLLLGRFEYTERGILDRTHCRLFTRGSFRKLHRACGFRVLHDGTTPIPFEFVFGAGLLTRACDAVNAGAAKIWPGLFAYQVMLEAEVDPDHPAPLVQHDQIHRRFDPYRVQPDGR